MSQTSAVFIAILSLSSLIGSLGDDTYYSWCCKSKAEYKKCTTLEAREDSLGNRKFNFQCVEGSGTNGCMEKIANGTADVITLDGADIYRYRNDIAVVAGENSGTGDASYYAIAVMKEEDQRLGGVSLFTLQDYKSCHTAIGKTAGWNMPIGWLSRNGFDVANLFNASCAPGAMIDKYRSIVPGGDTNKWCKLCIGDGNDRHVCDRDHDERYYGYEGAFKCMSEHNGRVAFVKHSIPDGKPGNFVLLCPDRTSAAPSDWRNCNLGRVPAHAVVMHKGISEEDAHSVFENLENARLSNDDFTTLEGKDKLWGSSVQSFLEIDNKSPKAYLGEDYYCNIQTLYDSQTEGNVDCDFHED